MNTQEFDIYNTNLESGIRTVVILDAIFPNQLDFESLLKSDFILVNSGDFLGPSSLHVKVPNRKGELITRREIVRSGIELMMRFGLVGTNLSKSGVSYISTEEAKPFLKLMDAKYSKDLQSVARWLASRINGNEFDEFDDELRKVMSI
ncbi:ABC-three component system middle component 2 [Vibrio paucivorans]